MINVTTKYNVEERVWLTHFPASSPSLRSQVGTQGQNCGGRLITGWCSGSFSASLLLQLRLIRWGMVLLSQRAGPCHINAECPQSLIDTDTVALIEAVLQLRSPLPWFCVTLTVRTNHHPPNLSMCWRNEICHQLNLLCFLVLLLQVGFLRVNYNRASPCFKSQTF